MSHADLVSLLWPPPRSAQGTDEDCVLSEAASYRCRIDTAHAQLGGRREAYELLVASDGVQIIAADEAGLFYGQQTLDQWRRLHGGKRVKGLRVLDWPDIANRGVMLDISRDKVPTTETLRGLVDKLASWKINQLQLYTEHTFAYVGHEKVWKDASALTGEQVDALDRYCADRFIELVPNQNSFGHFHRWLVHEPYRQLAECPDGIAHPFSDRTEPFSLCAIDPGSIVLLQDLYDQLLPHFRSDQINVGLDETFDLGQGRSKQACDARGRIEVYLEFLKQVHALVAARGRRMLFWGDIILTRPDLIAQLPGGDDLIALAWGYEADHPFAEQAEALASAGRPFYLCPGTSSWNSLGGRLNNALQNQIAAAAAARRSGAAGILITDWGDFGHLQPLPISYPGLLVGAGCAWNGDAAEGVLADELDVAVLLDRWAFADAARKTGAVLLALGDAYRRASATPPKNGSALFWLLWPDRALDSRQLRGCSVERLGSTREKIVAAEKMLAGAEPDEEIVVEELRWVAELLALCCRVGEARFAVGAPTVGELPSAVREQLAGALRPLVVQHREVWLARNRPGGRADSVRRLAELARALGG